jgi:hypothetical protein
MARRSRRGVPGVSVVAFDGDGVMFSAATCRAAPWRFTGVTAPQRDIDDLHLTNWGLVTRWR